MKLGNSLKIFNNATLLYIFDSIGLYILFAKRHFIVYTIFVPI